MTSAASRGASIAAAVHGLGFAHGQTTILRGIDLTLEQGRTLALLGPSGCGKTTLLRLLAGLLAPDRGRVEIAGTVMADAAGGRFVPPEKRGLGMVFQDYALWPHLSVARNVAFPLEMARRQRSEIKERVGRALELVGLADHAGRSPGDLSGGQQQRVAIARAIVAEPRLVLFDEPLSNLDRELRETLAGELAQLVRNLALSAVYVTHDHAEAFTIADEVAVMLDGAIAQLAPPQVLVDAPASPAVAEFLKLGTLVDAELHDGAWRLAGTGLALAEAAHGPAAARARLMLGPKALTLAPAEGAAMAGRVVQANFRGESYALTIAIGDGQRPVLVRAASARRVAPGETVGLAIAHQGLRWFPAISTT